MKRVIASIILAAVVASGGVLALSAQSTTGVACDSTTILLLYLAQKDYGYQPSGAPTFDYGQFGDWFSRLPAATATAPEATAAPAVTALTGATALSPLMVAGEDPACTQLRADLVQYLSGKLTTPTDGATTAAAACTLLNLNDVTEDQLLSTIPNFSNRMVREFQEYRPYVSIQQYQREIGKYVDEAQVAEWQQYVYVPVDVNNADEATLEQIPGVDAALAATLTAGRPYASNDAFLQALGASLDPQQVAQAGCYLAAQ